MVLSFLCIDVSTNKYYSKGILNKSKGSGKMSGMRQNYCDHCPTDHNAISKDEKEFVVNLESSKLKPKNIVHLCENCAKKISPTNHGEFYEV